MIINNPRPHLSHVDSFGRDHGSQVIFWPCLFYIKISVYWLSTGFSALWSGKKKPSCKWWCWDLRVFSFVHIVNPLFASVVYRQSFLLWWTDTYRTGEIQKKTNLRARNENSICWYLHSCLFLRVFVCKFFSSHDFLSLDVPSVSSCDSHHNIIMWLFVCRDLSFAANTSNSHTCSFTSSFTSSLLHSLLLSLTVINLWILSEYLLTNLYIAPFNRTSILLSQLPSTIYSSGWYEVLILLYIFSYTLSWYLHTLYTYPHFIISRDTSCLLIVGFVSESMNRVTPWIHRFETLWWTPHLSLQPCLSATYIHWNYSLRNLGE